MTTTTHPVTGLPTHDNRGRLIEPTNRTRHGLAARNAGMTWAEVASVAGYSSANMAEANVMRFVAWLNGNTRGARTTARHIAALDRSFGVEIEFAGITVARAAAAISEAIGSDVGTFGYHSTVGYAAWKVERDGSVTTRHGMGGEAVSPVLRGPEGLAQIKVVMEALRSAGARVDRRCGLHVHLDARDLSGEQIGRLMEVYVDRQDAIDQFVAPSRRRNGNYYCQRVSASEKATWKASLEHADFTDRRRIGYAERYRTVNLTSLGRTSTVEFRQHQGTLNGTKAVAWIEMLLAMSNAVVATRDETLPEAATELPAALAPFGLSAASIRNLNSRAA